MVGLPGRRTSRRPRRTARSPPPRSTPTARRSPPTAEPTPRRHHDRAGQRRDRRRPAHAGRAQHVLRHARVAGNETTRNLIAHSLLVLLERPDVKADLVANIDDDDLWALRHRGVPALGCVDPQLPSHRHARHRDRRSADQAGRQGRHLLRRRPTATRGLRRPEHVRHPPHAERPPDVRRRRRRTSASAPTWPGRRSRS